jgi:hypothetical protein
VVFTADDGPPTLVDGSPAPMLGAQTAGSPGAAVAISVAAQLNGVVSGLVAVVITAAVPVAGAGDASFAQSSASASVTVVDIDDTGPLRLLALPSSSPVLTVSENGSLTATLQVALNRAPEDASTQVVVTADSSLPSEIFISGSARLVLNATNWDRAARFVLRGVDDAVADGDSAARITLRATGLPAGTPAAALGFDAVNLDDEPRALVIAALAPRSWFSPLGIEAFVSVALASRPVAPVTVTLNPPAGVEALAMPATSTAARTMLFSVADFSVPRTVRIRGSGDPLSFEGAVDGV